MKVEIQTKNEIFQLISTAVLGENPENERKAIFEEIMLENFPELKKA